MSWKPRGARNHKRAGPAKNFVMLERYLLDCPAWKLASPNAKVIYVELKGRYNGRNNGLIRLSTREAGAALNASNDTGARALEELRQRGFIVTTEESSFNRKVHIARSYRLTEAASDIPGESRGPTKEFLKWKS